MVDVFKRAYEELEAGRPCALVILENLKCSGPRKPGAMMLVLNDGTTEGTVGGGTIEKNIVDTALESIAEEKLKRVSLTLREGKGDLELYCGGEVEFLIVPLLPKERLLIFGGGHVSKALVNLARQTGFRITVVDDRENFDWSGFPRDVNLINKNYEEFLENLDVTPSTFIVIATDTHEKDFLVLSNLLRRKTLPGFLGMLGSKSKLNTFKRRLNGDIRERINYLRTPVGIDIGAETPEEIAVSILAELIQVRRKRSEDR